MSSRSTRDVTLGRGATHARRVAKDRTPRGIAAVAALLVLCACGGQPSRLAEPAAPPREPYAGPLYLEDDDPLHDNPEFRRSAAEGAVDCDSEPIGAFNPEPDTTLGVSATPAKALTRARRKGALRGLESGYRVDRAEPTRVLFTADFDGRAKAAVIMHHAPTRFFGTGWYLEAWATCDLAELPPALAEAAGTEIWTDAEGRRVPTTTIASGRGGEGCGSSDMTFLVLGHELGQLSIQVYVANPDPELSEYFAEPYDPDLALPADAVDTGYELEGRHLWLSPDRRRAYVGSPERVELWPRTVKLLTCA